MAVGEQNKAKKKKIEYRPRKRFGVKNCQKKINKEADFFESSERIEIWF